MYRVPVKTTKKTKYYCLDCPHKMNEEKDSDGYCFIECGAENRCFTGRFNCADFYCREYKGMNELNEKEYKRIADNFHKKQSDKLFAEYAKKILSQTGKRND